MSMMARKSRKQVVRYQMDYCMRGLISVFDFRNARSLQKLLADTNGGSKQLDGAAYAKLKSLTNSCEKCSDTNGSVQCETATSDTEQDQKKEESITNRDGKPGVTAAGAHIKKNRRWMRNKMSKAEDLVAGKPSHQKDKSCVVVEELYNIIHQRDTRCRKHGQDGEPTEDPSAIELDEQLWESTKVLMNHFTDGSGCLQDGTIQPSNELTNALQVLNSNKDFFLKLLQDPNSPLVKHTHNSQVVQLEDEKFKVPTGSDILGQDMGVAKRRGFFRRRFKSLERNSFRKIDSSEDIRKIVVLKPASRIPENANISTPCSSLTEYLSSTLDKTQIKKAVSPFSFAEFKRKLKHAMRKEQHALSHQSSYEKMNHVIRDKKISGDSIIMASPSRRDHLFVDRIPNFLVGIKTGKLKDINVLTPEKRVLNLDIEAKKHIAEIVKNRDIDKVHDDNPGKRSPRTLGRILAYSDYSSPIGSPRAEGDMRLTPNGECQTSDLKTMSQVTLARNVTPSIQMRSKSEIKTCLISDNPILETEVPIVELCISDELPHDTNCDKPILETEIPTSEDSQRFSKEEPRKESEKTPSPSIRFSPDCITTSELVDSPLICSEESLHLASFKQEICEESEPSSSTASTCIYKVIDEFEDLCTISIATSRPSPISVLDPVFLDDDSSPPGMKYWNVIQPIQPQQVRFGEEFSEPVEKIPSDGICVDNTYTIKFVKDIVHMSGLTWDELFRRSLFADHIVDPSLLDEIDFLPELLSCDFNNLFDLISEVLIDICWINFGFMLSLATTYVHPESKGKDIFTEVWKRVDWYLKLESPTNTLNQIIVNDLTKAEKWIDLQLDCQNIGIQIQEAIFEDLMDETILSFCAEGSKINFSVPLPVETKEIVLDLKYENM